MAFQSVPYTFSVLLNYRWQNEPCQNELFYLTEAEFYDNETLESLLTQIDVWVAAEWLALLPSDLAYFSTEGRGLMLAEDITGISITNSGSPGAASNVGPNNVAKAIQRTSGLSGRSQRGRIFFPLGTSYLQTGNQNYVDAGAINAVVDALELLPSNEDMGAGVICAPCIVSRWGNGVLRTPALTHLITSWGISDLTTDSMRRRLPTS